MALQVAAACRTAAAQPSGTRTTLAQSPSMRTVSIATWNPQSNWIFPVLVVRHTFRLRLMRKSKDATHWRLRLPVGDFGIMVALDGPENERPADTASSHLTCGWDILTFSSLASVVFLYLLAVYRGESVDASLSSTCLAGVDILVVI